MNPSVLQNQIPIVHRVNISFPFFFRNVMRDILQRHKCLLLHPICDSVVIFHPDAVSQPFSLSVRLTPTCAFFHCVPSRRSLMNSGLCRTPTPTSSSCASAWSTPPPFTTSPRSGSRRSAPATPPRPSSWWAPSRTSCWTSTSSSTWTDPTSSLFWAPGRGAWRRRSGPPTTSSARRSRRRT